MNTIRLLRIILSTSTVALVTACSQYEYNLNGHNLYRPAALLSDFSLEDPSLSQCVKKTILEQKIVRADDLIQLHCPASGIKTARGLEIFKGLRIVDMAQNALVDLAGIQTLPKLEQLNADGNPALACNSLQVIRAKGVKVHAVQCFKE